MLPPSCVKHTYKFKSKTSLLDLTLKLVSPCASHIMSLSGPYPALKLSLSYLFFSLFCPYPGLILALSFLTHVLILSLSLPYPSWLLSLSCPFLVLILPNSCPYPVLILSLSWPYREENTTNSETLVITQCAHDKKGASSDDVYTR